jgi:hypothetical protein
MKEKKFEKIKFFCADGEKFFKFSLKKIYRKSDCVEFEILF